MDQRTGRPTSRPTSRPTGRGNGGRSPVVTGALWLPVAALAVAGLATLLTVVFTGELVEEWAADRPSVGSVSPPAFGPVAVTMFVVVAMLTFVVLAFFRHGHEWARILLSLTVVVLAAATLAVLRTDPPTLFVVVAVVSLLVDLAAVVALWHRETRAFCRGSGSAPAA